VSRARGVSSLGVLRRWWLFGRARGEAGTASAELVVLVVPIMVLMAFAVFVGRYSATSQEVSSAAKDAARAAAVRDLPSGAQRAGETAARESLADRGVSCQGLATVIDTSELHPGGQVTAEVRCELGLGDIAGLGLPGSKTLTARSTAVVDTYRGGESP
jgi:Flp pilus assembly protein TadG